MTFELKYPQPAIITELLTYQYNPAWQAFLQKLQKVQLFTYLHSLKGGGLMYTMMKGTSHCELVEATETLL